MKLSIKKSVARMLLWSVLFNALSPLAAFAQNNYYRPSLGKVAVPKIKMNSSRVHKGDIAVDLTVNDDAIRENDITKGGSNSCFQKQSNCRPKPKCFDADYIIIGMGTAGAVLANKLSADKHTSVIGLEAGDNNNDEEPIYDPSFAPFLEGLFIPDYFWQGETLNAPEVDNRSFLWTGGRLLGGGSSVNNAVVVKGTPAYWQTVEDAVGSDWSVSNVFKRYKELETYIGPKGPGPNTRGEKGPWTNIALPENPTADSYYLLDAMVDATGLPAIVDYNNPETPNGPVLRINMQERVGNLRESSAFAFLGADVMTPNGFGIDGRKLRVHFRSTALDLLWCDNKVIGVRYTQNGKCHEIFAKEEVIVSAGFQSAQFLQRNGIGPKDVLNAAGVPVRIENANIGALKTHPVMVDIVFSTPGANFVPEGEPFSYGAPGAFLPQAAGDSRRNIIWIGFGIFPEVLVMVLLAPQNPASTGSVAIQNDDPLKIPLVDIGFYSDTDGIGGTSADLDNTVAAIRDFILPLNDYFATPGNEAPNGQTWSLISPSPAIINDDVAIRDFIRSTVFAAYHWSATVPMGADASTGAVDSRGRVFGTEGLRVADVSILPYIPDANTATPAVLIGWTISEFILAGN